MTAEESVDGRPSPGQTLASGLADAAAKRPRSRDVRTLGRLWPFMLNHWGQLVFVGLFLLISTASSLGLTGAVRVLVDRGFASGSEAALNTYFLLLSGVAAILAVATAARFFFVTRLGERIVADLRQALYRKTLTLDQTFFLKTRTGEVLSRLTTDVTLIESMVGSSASIALRNLLSLIGALILLIVVSPHLALWVILVAPIVVLPLFVFGRRVRSLSTRAQDRFADAVGFAGESLDALDTVQAFGRETQADKRFSGAVERAFAASVARIRARAYMTAMVILLVFGGIAFALWRGAHAVFVAHSMSGGTLVQFVFLAVMAAGSVGALGEVWGEVQKAAGAMQRIGELLDAKPMISAPANPVAMPKPPIGRIEFDAVTFAYPGRPDLPALRDVSLTVEPGETVALVGPSGGGKSTMLRLLLRFYDPQAGCIRLDGVDLRRADPSEVRARLALVAQDAPLFSGSAMDNIQYGRDGASEADVRAAAKAAEADGFISALPEGYETPVGERAKTLSGGQRQRLAIARALIRSAPVLLLDEATSALDAENERLVQRALHDAMTGRTTLVIAHRLATVLRADRIVVLDEGRIVDIGTHSELIARGGLYAKLAGLQFGLAAA